MGEQNTASEKVQNSRYWEYYLVRYLLGTVIGVVCILYIGKKLEIDDQKFNFFKAVSTEILSQSKREIAHFDPASDLLKNNPVILLLIGFVYTYIASAPILILHSVRLIHQKYFESENKRNLIHLVPLVVLFSYLTSLLFRFYNYSNWTFLPNSELVSCSLLVFFFIGQVLLLYFRFKENNFFSQRTKELSQKRSGNAWETKNISDYVESYRHLREHSNAFFITLLTITLTFIICNQSILPTELVLFIWILPSSAIWFVATLLELRLIE